MSWLLAIGLALAAFAVLTFACGAPRRLWTIPAAALALGLAGYALQASPGMTGAPAMAGRMEQGQGWELVEARREMIAEEDRSANNRVLVADAMARRGQFANAAALLLAAGHDNPRDGEAWLALGNALVEHAEGRLTPAALLAYRRAAEANPASVAPGYFFGLALVRQGEMMRARAVWEQTLRASEGAADDPARVLVAERLARLDDLLGRAGAIPAVDTP